VALLRLITDYFNATENVTDVNSNAFKAAAEEVEESLKHVLQNEATLVTQMFVHSIDEVDTDGQNVTHGVNVLIVAAGNEFIFCKVQHVACYRKRQGCVGKLQGELH